jgi:hypothetical protein
MFESGFNCFKKLLAKHVMRSHYGFILRNGTAVIIRYRAVFRGESHPSFRGRGGLT